jgi:XRE family transcriptional regulator, regulator of sulfur utilization
MIELVHEFGRTVRRLREANAWSQERLAGYAGLSRSYVGEIERGTVVVSIVTLDKLARAFGVSAAALLDVGVNAPCEDPVTLPPGSQLPLAADEPRAGS